LVACTTTQHQSSGTHGNSNNVRKQKLQKSPQDKQGKKGKKKQEEEVLSLQCELLETFIQQKEANPSQEQTTPQNKTNEN
jgi:hypothetical protein